MTTMYSTRNDPSFLPHPRTPPSPQAQLHGLTQMSQIGHTRPGYRRSKSSSTVNSKSAPTSPAGRIHLSGLTPISTITNLDLGHGVQSETASRSRSLTTPASLASTDGSHREHRRKSGDGPSMLIGRVDGKNAVQDDSKRVGKQVQSYNRHVSHPLPPSVASAQQQAAQKHYIQQQQIHPSNVYTTPQNAYPTQQQQQHIHPQHQQPLPKGIPPLLNPAARIKTFPRILHNTDGQSDTETELSGNDSDATYRPHRYPSNVSSGSNSTAGSIDSNGLRKRQNAGSQSQPDLTALRSRLEGWVGGVAKETIDPRVLQQQQQQLRGKTPPSKNMPLHSQSGLIVSPKSKSTASLSTLKRQSSPREPPMIVSPMTPLLSSSSDGSSPREYRMDTGGLGLIHHMGLGEGMNSETGDADDDDSYGDLTDSPSSGSISFSSKGRGTRGRISGDRSKGGLGLSFDSDPLFSSGRKEEPIPLLIERRLQQSSLLSLRLLAIVPSLWGIVVLFNGFINGEVGVDVWPWGVDLSRDALERLVAGGAWNEGKVRRVSRGDMVLSMAWALCTAHFCFSLTTGLTYRWRSYYSLTSTLTRLLSLQCICWPATYLTLWFLTAQRPLLCWIVIGVTTGWSRTVQMWVTSNVPEPTPGEVTPKVRPKGIIVPEDLGFWESFLWGRSWDWDKVARKVGWKVGVLLLITTAWMFWGLETGRLVEHV